MKKTLKNTIRLLPEILVKNAQSMMRRMIAAMQNEITQDSRLANASYSALLLKVSEAELIHEFDVAIRDAMKTTAFDPNKTGVTATDLSMSLELVDDEAKSSKEDFRTSTALFSTLCANARNVGVAGVDAFNKDVFLIPLKNAFEKSRIDSEEMAKLMPYARRALNSELLNVYGKLDALERVGSTRPMPLS